MADHQYLLAIFAYIDDVLGALGSLKGQRASVEKLYTPAPNAQLEKALGTRPSPVRRFMLAGALLGISFGIFISIYTATRWNLIIWGKQPISMVPYVVVAFEFCILFSVLFGIGGFLILTRLPGRVVQGHFDARFTVDRYGLLLSCPADRRQAIISLLREAGAEEVRDAGV